MLELILVKKNSIEKQVAKSSEMMVLQPLKKYQILVEKLFCPMSFEEKIMGGNKIKNVPIISEAKLRLTSQFSIKVYVGNTPLNHC
jgi:hypothetical protein